jgi:hypothetical protein
MEDVKVCTCVTERVETFTSNAICLTLRAAKIRPLSGECMISQRLPEVIVILKANIARKETLIVSIRFIKTTYTNQ